MDVDMDQIINFIEVSDMTSKEKQFLIINLKNLEDAFKSKFKHTPFFSL